MIQAGRLDRRIVIKRPSDSTDDGYASVPGEPVGYATRWASWKPSNGREAFENRGIEAKAGGTFWLRYDTQTAGIAQTDVVEFSGRTWNIVAIQEIGRREGIELIVVAAS